MTCSLTVTVYATQLGAANTALARGVDVTVNVNADMWGNRPTIWQGRGTTGSNGQVTMDVPPGYLQVVGKRGSTTYVGTGYETSGTPASCLASMSLYPEYDWNNPAPPSPPTLAISYPGTLNLNQAKTVSWTGGRQSNNIILQRLNPLNDQMTTTTLVSNSILVNGSVSFTPTVPNEVHVFIIEATDANGDVYQESTPGEVPT